MSQLFPPSRDEIIACLEREVKLRERVYPRGVAAGRLTKAKADREIECMRAALETFRSQTP